MLAQDWQPLPDGSVGYATEFRGAGGTAIPAYLRKPKGRGKFPVVVLLHGAGASKEGTYGLGSRTTAPTGYFVAAGWAVYSIDFRSESSYKGAEWDDAVAAVAAVRRMDFIDGGRLALMGGSHGGHVMARISSRVEARCAVLCSPAVIDPIEISRFIATGAPINPVLKSIVKNLEKEKGASIERIAKDPAKYGYESPLTEAAKVRCPAVLFINGLHDTSSPIPVIEAYSKALRASGHEVEMYTPETGPHGFYFGLPEFIPETDEAARRAVAFIGKHFK